jgi:hypothetical protein
VVLPSVRKLILYFNMYIDHEDIQMFELPSTVSLLCYLYKHNMIMSKLFKKNMFLI